MRLNTPRVIREAFEQNSSDYSKFKLFELVAMSNGRFDLADEFVKTAEKEKEIAKNCLLKIIKDIKFNNYLDIVMQRADEVEKQYQLLIESIKKELDSILINEPNNIKKINFINSALIKTNAILKSKQVSSEVLRRIKEDLNDQK